MPKMKTHKGARKRFRATATGKVQRAKANKRHLNSHKSAKRKMRLRRKAIETGRWGNKYLKAVGA